jgi:hypothetical protein
MSSLRSLKSRRTVDSVAPRLLILPITDRRVQRKSGPLRALFKAGAALPHGTNVNITWDAEAGKWLGTLTIPPPRSGIFKESVISADDSALFTLCQRLDRKVRDLKEAALTVPWRHSWA